jgi:ribosomal protein L10
MSKKIKELEMTALRTTFEGVKDCLILEPIKVDSATDYEFRRRLREKKARVQLVKNTFVKKVFLENGITVDVWSGPSLLVWGADSIKGLSNAVDVLIKELKKDPKAPDKFKVKTAVADGQPVTFEAAKTMPTRLEAIGEVVSALMGAGSAIAGCLTGPASELAGILSTIEEKGGAAGAEAPTAEAPTAEAPAAEAPPAEAAPAG